MTGLNNESQSLDYDIKIIENPDFLHLELTGRLDSKRINLVIQGIEAALTSGKHSDLLIDSRQFEIATPTMAFNFSSRAISKAKSHNFNKLAYIGKKKFIQFKKAYESTAKAFGVNLRIFYEEDKAIEWLLEK